MSKNYDNIFTKKATEYTDHINLPEKEQEYYTRFKSEYYDNQVSQDPEKIKDQLHNTKELVSSVYNSTNSRNRDLLSTQKATNQLQELNEEVNYKDVYEEDKYTSMLKTEGYSETIRGMFQEFSDEFTQINTQPQSINLLKLFYITIQRVNREERKWLRKEKQISKEKKSI